LEIDERTDFIVCETTNQQNNNRANNPAKPWFCPIQFQTMLLVPLRPFYRHHNNDKDRFRPNVGLDKETIKSP
jgi:hypothetical protein